MNFNNLNTPGANPSGTLNQLLHIGIGNLVDGALVRLGDGTATPLTLHTSGITVEGSVTTSTLTATSLILDGVTMRPTTWKVMDVNVATADANNTALPQLTFTPQNGAKYALEMLLIINSVAQAGAAHIVNTGGSGVLYLMDPQTALGITATGGSYSPTTSGATGPWVLMLKGIFIASSTADLTFAIKREDANNVTALIGSHQQITKLS